MQALSFIGDVFKPAAKLIDDLHTSDEEKLKLKNNLEDIHFNMKSKVLKYEEELMKAQATVLKAESNGQSWIQRNWRPLTMLTFLFLIVCDSFGLLRFRLADEAWVLLQIGLGGYVVGRSLEKVTPNITKVIKKQ